MGEQDIFDTNPFVSTVAYTIIGLVLIGDLTAQEQNALGNGLMLTAQVLVTNAANQNVIQTRANPPFTNINSKRIKSVYNPLVYDIPTLMEVLKNMDPNGYNSSMDLIKKSINKMNEEINKLKN